MSKLREKDTQGNVIARKDVLPYIQRLNRLGVQPHRIADLLDYVKITDKGGNTKSSAMKIGQR